MAQAPKVIESYPGAAQDILCIPRKQKGLDPQRAGLRELGLRGPGLRTQSHDEMLEEAYAGLDVATRTRLGRVVWRLMRDGCRVLVATHRLEEIPTVATHC